MKFLLILCLTLLLINVTRTYGQQCMDLMPPFVPSRPLLFCEDYSKYGCCSSTDDQNLRQLLENIRRQSRRNNARRTSATCLRNVKSILCARCSPFSAEIFQRTIIHPGAGQIVGLFPSLCGGLCKRFVNRCSDILLDYFAIVGSNGKRMEEALFSQPLTNSTSSEDFCNLIKMPPHRLEYCYPAVDSTNGESSKFTEYKDNITGCVCLQPLSKSFRSPIVITNANDNTGRLFIAEQIGTIKVILPDGSSPKTDFLDIQSTVYTGNKSSALGLLGFTFHPNFKENSKLYIFYTLEKNSNVVSRVEEFRVHDTDTNIVDTGTSRVILEIPKYTSNHAGGTLLFGKDGYMYIFTGDDGGDGDAMEIAQDLFMLSGKVLRINVDVTDFIAGNEYSIPSDNPFAADDSLGLPEIYAWGLRNPRKCSIDRAMPENRIFCADEGADTFEEVNIIKKKANFGWNIKEGTKDFCPECLRGFTFYSVNAHGLPEVNITYPIFEYRHSLGVSVVGGHVYRGCANPNLNGEYIFGDLKNGLFRLKENGVKHNWEGERLELCPASQCLGTLTNQIKPYILSFGESEEGEIYVSTSSSLSLTSQSALVYKIIDPVRRGDPELCKSARPVTGLSLTGGLYPTITSRKNVVRAPTQTRQPTTATPRTAAPRRLQIPTSETQLRNLVQQPRGENRESQRDNQRPRSRWNFIQRLFGRRGNNRNEPRNEASAQTGSNRPTNTPATVNRAEGNQQSGNGLRTLGRGAVVVNSNQGATVVRVNGKK